MIDVAAKDLRVGDFLPATKRIVVRPPRAGAKTPSGKVELLLQDARADDESLATGMPQQVIWGRNTTIGVRRDQD